MSTFLATSIVPQIDLRLLRRDYFDGFSLLLQQSNGTPYNLSNVQVCASVWRRNTDLSYSLLTNFNVEEQEPLSAGRIRLWLSSAQTAILWDEYGQSGLVGGAFFPNAYSSSASFSASSPIVWDVRVEIQEQLTDLISASGGTFISQNNHTLGSSERVIFNGTTASGINFDGTSSTIYSGLTNISYLPPYAFSVPALSGITASGIGGSVGRLKQDTVVGGSVIVDTTVSNCFP